MSGLQQTNGIAPPNRVDFNKEDYDVLIEQKGRRVLVEKALLCPCKSPSVNQQSNCKNCGGTGYAFVNAHETRMIIQKINLVNDFAPWSEENRGFANISFNASEELTWMDKITALDGIVIFNEVLFFKQKASEIFTYTVYPIKGIVYVGLWIDVDQQYQELTLGTDYTYENNVIKLINNSLVQGTVDNTNITIRYKHAPVFHLIEMKRETMETFEWKDGEVLRHLPLSAVARRAHYIPNINNLSGDRLLNNDFVEKTNCNNNCQ